MCIRDRSKSAFFERGWVTLNADFRGKVASPTNHCWCQQTRAIALSCGITISAVHCLVVSQSTRVTDGQTDIHTDGQKGIQNTTANIALACVAYITRRYIKRSRRKSHWQKFNRNAVLNTVTKSNVCVTPILFYIKTKVLVVVFIFVRNVNMTNHDFYVNMTPMI